MDREVVISFKVNTIKFRESNKEDHEHLKLSLEQFNKEYIRTFPDQDSHLTNTDQLISACRHLDHEGVTLLNADLNLITPLIVLHCLIQTENGTLVIVEVENKIPQYGMTHPLLPDTVTEYEIATGKYILEPDFDEPPTASELALESYDALKSLLARKRIGRGIVK